MLHLRGEGVYLCAQRVQALVRVAQHVLRRPVRRIYGYLRYKAEALRRGDHHLALVIADLPDDNIQQRRLSAAVMAEDADALAGVDREGQTVQYIFSDLEGFYQRAYGYVYHVFPVLNSL